MKTGVALAHPVSGRVDASAGTEGWWNVVTHHRNGLPWRFEEQNPRELRDSCSSGSWPFPIIAGARVGF